MTHSDHSEALEALAASASALIHQAIELLDQIERHPDHLTFKSTLLPGSTIGKHFRHVHDHFRLLLEAIDTQDFLNYDKRTRDIAMETSPAEAKRVYQELDEQIHNICSQTPADTHMRLHAVTPYPQEFDTTFGRELWFCEMHAIHHYSLLRVIAVGELKLQVPENFGVAPSTIAFRGFSEQRKQPEEAKVPELPHHAKL